MIIDTDDYAAAGIETLTFPAGEWHCNVPTLDVAAVTIFAKLRSADDALKLLVVADAIQTQGIRISLFCPYLPAARMDRNPGGNSELGVAIYARLLADVPMGGPIGGGGIVTAVDVHSEIAYREYALQVKLNTLDTALWLPTLVKGKPDFILCPDKGAHARALAAAMLFGFVPIITCEKRRDFCTGKLFGFHVPQHESFVGARYLIVDDICDGGGTFAGIHEAWLKVAPPEARLDLYVTHGIFSNGAITRMTALFDNVYTTDSFCRSDSFDNFHVEPLLGHYLRSQE